MKERDKTQDKLIEKLQELEKQCALLEAEKLSQFNQISELRKFKTISDSAHVLPLLVLLTFQL